MYIYCGLAVQAGLAARARQRYTQAVEHYTAAIEVRVHSCTYNATLYNERADVYYRMGQHIMAIADCYMSKALDPFSALPICIRGRSFKALGYYSLAIKVRSFGLRSQESCPK